MSAQPSLSLALCLPIYSDRDNAQAVKLFCRAGPKSDFSTEVRLRILMDVDGEQLRLLTETVSEAARSKRVLAKGEIKIKGKAEDTIAAYYGISSRTIRGWKKKEATGLETKQRPGRPRQVTGPVKRKICDTFNEGNGRSIRGTTAKLLN